MTQLVSEIEFKELFKILPDAVILIDCATQLPVMFNQIAYKQLEYEKEEFKNITIAQYEACEKPEETQRHIDNIIANKRDDFETQHRTKYGKIIDIQVTVILQMIEEKSYFLCIFRNITQQKKLEEIIKEKEKRFSDVAEAAGEYVWELDANGEYTFLTKPFEIMMGYTLEESLGKSPFSFMPLDEQQRVQEYFVNEVAKKGVAFRGLTHRSLTKNGDTIWQKVNGLPMIDKDGNIVGYRGAALDITTEKKVEEDLKAAKEKAEEASLAKTQFLANMSHEIRTPMNAIIGLGDMLTDLLSDPKQKDILHKINSSSKMLLGIINDILDYSKIEAGKLELEHKKFLLEHVLSQLKVMFEQKASKKGIELYFYPKGEGLGSLFGDELRLTQVLTNLVSNAIKFTHSGNIIVTIGQKEICENQKALLEFSVEDSGIGMSEEQLAKLFQPFTQADSSTTRKYGGSGLGLVISRNIVNVMGGDISVVSKVGVGTKFSFSLEFELASCEVDYKNNTAGMRALVVDDQAISREVLKAMLHRFGYMCDEAIDGIEAIELLKQSNCNNTPYDIVLIDWNMPRLNGIETIKKIHTMIETKELITKTPVIFMVSGYDKDTIGLSDTKIDSFLSKPITASTLFDAISDAKLGIKKDIEFIEGYESPDFEGLTVLIVEDNELNQEVVSMMLHKVNIAYDIASNGKEGVEVFLKNPKRYDLILMDLQMPIMSGYEATRIIREYDKAIPIVALTAAAMIEDKEKVLKAGMNEHIAKPIDKKELYNTIARITHIECEYKKNNITELKTLDTLYLLGLLETKEKSNALLKKFYTQLTQGEFKDITKILTKNLLDGATLTHTLKGVSGNLGAFELCEVLTVLDAKYKKNQMITQEDSDQLNTAYMKLVGVLGSLIEEMSCNKEDDNQSISKQKISQKELKKLYFESIALLYDGVLVEDTLVSTLYENLQTRVPLEELTRWKDLIEEFEFDDALVVMKKWESLL